MSSSRVAQASPPRMPIKKLLRDCGTADLDPLLDAGEPSAVPFYGSKHAGPACPYCVRIVSAPKERTLNDGIGDHSLLMWSPLDRVTLCKRGTWQSILSPDQAHQACRATRALAPKLGDSARSG